MTRVDKSPEQLDAEAAAPLEERDLDAAILFHRALFGAELGSMMRLHQQDGDDQGIGPPFNSLFADFLDSNFYALPWHRSWDFLTWNVCYARHTAHREREAWGDSLCCTLVSLVIRHENSLDYARLQLGLADDARARRILGSALLVIERRLDQLLSDEQARQTPARKPAEWMGPPHVHRHPPSSSLEDCPQCRRAA